MSRSNTAWRSGLEPMLVGKMGLQPRNAIEPVRSATEQFRNADLRPNKTEEEMDLTERTDDIATSTKLSPAVVNQVPQRATDPIQNYCGNARRHSFPTFY